MSNRKQSRRFNHQVETLERRRLLSASLDRLFANGERVDPLDPPVVVRGTPVLTINGFSDNDTIFVAVGSGTISWTIDGTAFSDDDSLYSQIVINGLGGADTITLASTGDNAVEINGGDGNDSITVGGPGTDLGLIDTAVSVNGGNDSDTITFDDSAFTGGSGYTLNSTQLVVPSVAPITYTEVEGAILNCASGNDSIDVDSNTIPVTINANGGSDAIRLSQSLQNLQNLAADVSVEGGIGNDTLTMNDQASAIAGGYQFFNGLIRRNSGLGTNTNYATLEGLVFNGSANADVLQVDNIPSGLSATLNGGDGNDESSVGFGPGTMADIQGPLTLSGGTNTAGGSDLVQFYDDFISEARAYTLSNAQLQSLGRATIMFNTFEAGLLEATTGDNTVNIDLSTAGAAFTINTLAGDDDVNATISNPGISTPVFNVNGGADDMGDEVSLTDPTNTFGDAWTVEATRVFRNFFGGMNYAGIEVLRLTCGPAGNRIDINGANVPTGYLIDAGGGIDDIHVNNTNSKFINIAGGAGEDILTVESDGKAFVQVGESFGAVAVNGAGELLLGPAAFGLRSLSVSSTADVDIREATLVINYTGASPQADVVADIVNGNLRSAETSSNPGTAVGYGEIADLFSVIPPNFAGIPVDSTTLVVRYTYLGDADLNRAVNLDDFTRLAGNFGQSPRGWAQGNFNFDAGVTLDDFTALAANFGRSFPAPLARAGGAVAGEDDRGSEPTSTRRIFSELEI